ncbi:hypothetical protein ACWC5I_48575 [Kitasatospora sp. NPDC001574]
MAPGILGSLRIVVDRAGLRLFPAQRATLATLGRQSGRDLVRFPGSGPALARVRALRPTVVSHDGASAGKATRDIEITNRLSHRRVHSVKEGRNRKV